MAKNSSEAKLPTPLEVVDYNFNSSVIRIGQFGRTSLNLKPEQDIYIYEDLNNLQLVLCVYELKRSIYRSIISFSKIKDFVKLGAELSKGINILSISFYKRDVKYRATLLYEVLDFFRSKRGKSDLKTVLEEYHQNHLDTKDKIEVEVLDTIEYSEDEEKNERVKDIVVPLIQYHDIFKKRLKSVKISKNWTIYYKLSKDFKERAFPNLKADACKCIQIAELDVGILILKFYETGIFKINIETLNLPGSFVRLINICESLNIEIEAIDLQKISLEEEGSAEIIYILKFPDEIKNKIKIFSWDKIPTNDEETEKLREFLNQQPGFEWVKEAKIEKISHGKTIKVSTDKSSLSLKRNDKKDKVSLETDGAKPKEFRIENDTVYNVDEINEDKIKKLLYEADTVLKEEDPEHGKIVDMQEKILEKITKKDKSFIHKIKIL